MECEPPLINMPAFEPRLSNFSDPPPPGVRLTLFAVDNTIEPTVMGASKLILLAEVGDERKFAVTPAPFGTCAGELQFAAEFQVPPPASAQVDPKFGEPITNALS